MGWIILSGKPGTTGYDAELQLVRHNGTTGEAGDFTFPIGGYGQSSTARFRMAGTYGYLSFDLVSLQDIMFRFDFTTWPPQREAVSFNSAGTPVPLDGYFKVGSFYYGLGGNYAGGLTPMAAISSDGLAFYSRYQFDGVNHNAVMRAGANGRFVFLVVGDVALYHTDNFIDFTRVTTGSGSPSISVYFFDAAGNSAGKWVVCKHSLLGNSSLVSTDNLATLTLLPDLAFSRVWAYGSVLYGVVGGRIYSSSDATTWTDKGLPFGSASIAVSKITYDGTSTFLIVGAYGNAVTTTDFATYTALPGYDFNGHQLYDADYALNSVIYPAASDPVLTLSQLESGLISTSYSSGTVGTVTGGTPPYTWAGTVKNPANQEVHSFTQNSFTFTPIVLGNYSFTVTVTDSEESSDQETGTFLVTNGGGTTGLTFATTTMPDATANAAYSAPVGTASGGTTPYTWAITSKSWADSAAISSTGILTTTFTSEGNKTLTVSVTDSSSPAQVISKSIAVTVVANTHTATIQGTLRLDTATGEFAARKVYLYSYTTGEKISETLSNATTGVWSFTQVAPGDYFVVGAAQGTDLTVPRDFDAMGVITVV